MAKADASKLVTDLRPGDQVTRLLTVTQVIHTEGRVEVTFDDGTTQSFDLTRDPAVEVVATSEAQQAGSGA